MQQKEPRAKVFISKTEPPLQWHSQGGSCCRPPKLEPDNKLGGGGRHNKLTKTVKTKNE